MYTITVTQKGQVVIPASIRKKLNIKKGTKLYVNNREETILMTPASSSYISRMKGSLEYKGSMTEYLLKERSEEFEKMEKKWKK